MVEFNEDGSIKVPGKKVISSSETSESSELLHLKVLEALDEIPFSVGKKLLGSFLEGDVAGHPSIVKNHLDLYRYFGSLTLEKDKVEPLIDDMLRNGYISQVAAKFNKFIKLLQLSKKGRDELNNPSYVRTVRSFVSKVSPVTDADREVFEHFKSFLWKYNEEQKKSIISPTKNILCIAGAGSGKTTVLTKRIEFLIRYRDFNPKRILAITFTRKARTEMEQRLAKQGIFTNVETFNSFCEKILRKHNDLIYEQSVHVMSYSDKMVSVRHALTSLNYTMQRAINNYFSIAQRKSKTKEQLAHVFVNDCFSVLDYIKSNSDKLINFADDAEPKDFENAQMLQSICNYLDAYMKKKGLRDYTDQILDALNFFKNFKEYIPEFDHILIDEYQDVNAVQVKLIDILRNKNSSNLFCVGDPRQSIYGWRGSDISFILDFDKNNKGCEVIHLVKNYRSTKAIVELSNKSIKHMNLPDLKSHRTGDKDIMLLKFKNDLSEFEFVVQTIMNSKIPRSEIFVLSRTNKYLKDLSDILRIRGIPHIVRTDEIRKTVVATDEQITLATIHSIKGLEAEMVFVIGATSLNFPCRASDHPVIDLVKLDEYNKEAEERRLFYVALSRAKNNLYITFTGAKPTYFMTDDMKKFVDADLAIDLLDKLKDWRLQKSHDLRDIPAYYIFSDATLEEIALKKPQTLIELESIRGFGPTKIMKYGEELLNLID